MNYYLIYSSLVIGGILLTCGDLFMKSWASGGGGKISNYCIGVLFWIIGSLFLAWTYKYKNMAVATIIYLFFNVATLVLFSMFYYKEFLTIKQWIGLVLGFIAVCLM